MQQTHLKVQRILKDTMKGFGSIRHTEVQWQTLFFLSAGDAGEASKVEPKFQVPKWQAQDLAGRAGFQFPPEEK